MNGNQKGGEDVDEEGREEEGFEEGCYQDKGGGCKVVVEGEQGGGGVEIFH